MRVIESIAAAKGEGSTELFFANAGDKNTGHEAAEHGHGEAHHAGVETLIWPGINFAIFFGICVWIYLNKLAPLLVKRADEFDKHRRESEKLMQAAEAELRAIEQSRKNLPVDKDKMLTQALSDGRNLAESITDDAEKQIAYMKQSLEKRIAVEGRAAEAEVKMKLIERAATLSRDGLRKELSVDQDRSFRERCFQDFSALIKS